MPKPRAASSVASAELLIPDDVVAYYEREEGSSYDAAAARTLFLVRALAQRINDVSAIWLAPFGLTPLSFQVIARLQATPNSALSLSVISRSIHTRATTVTSLVDALERDGLVRRIEHATDRRATLASLTPKGRKLSARATRSQHRHIAGILKTVNLREREMLIAVLLEIGDALCREKARLTAPSKKVTLSGQ